MDEDLQTVIDNYAEMIYKIALVRLGCRAEAEDVVQEILIKYMLNKKTFKSAEHEKNWFIKVTLNYIHDLKENNFKKSTESIEKARNLEYTYNNELFDSLELLKYNYKVVTQLFYMEGIPVKEISNILEISESNVKTRLKRARKMLGKLIDEGEYRDELFR